MKQQQLEQQRSEQRQLEKKKELKQQKKLEQQQRMEAQKKLEQEKKAEFREKLKQQQLKSQKRLERKIKEEEGKSLPSFLLEFKPAYFYLQDKTLRNIYGKSVFMALLELNQQIMNEWYLYLDSGYSRFHGNVASADITQTLVTVSLGLKYTWPVVKFVWLYAKLGPTWFYSKSKLDAACAYPWVQKISIKKTYGFKSGIGGLIYLTNRFYLDLFMSYLYGKKTFLDPTSNKHLKVWLGGVEAGIGLGYGF